MEQEQARLRRAPVERFAGTDSVHNLAEIAAQLRAEPHPATDGHRQMTIAHHGPVALVLFDFEADGRLVDLSLIHISEPTRLGMISYAVFCLKKKNKRT